MAVSSYIRPSIIVVVAEGEYTVEELIQGVRNGLDEFDELIRPCLLFDQRMSESLQTRTNKELRDIAAYGNSIRERIGRRVAFVTSGLLEFGLARMGSAYLDDDELELNVFTEIEAAFEWLSEK